MEGYFGNFALCWMGRILKKGCYGLSRLGLIIRIQGHLGCQITNKNFDYLVLVKQEVGFLQGFS